PIRERVHRELEEQMRAQRREPDDHEAPLSDRLAQLIAGLQTGHPRVIQPLRPAAEPGINSGVRSTEVQNQRYFSRRQQPLPRRPHQRGRSREIAMHVRTKARVGSTFNLVPSPELRRVPRYAHRPSYLHRTTYPGGPGLSQLKIAGTLTQPSG